MKTLFQEPKQTYRRSNGQFATKEMAYADKQATDNKRLSFEVEKYKRMYLAILQNSLASCAIRATGNMKSSKKVVN